MRDYFLFVAVTSVIWIPTICVYVWLHNRWCRKVLGLLDAMQRDTAWIDYDLRRMQAKAEGKPLPIPPPAPPNVGLYP